VAKRQKPWWIIASMSKRRYQSLYAWSKTHRLHQAIAKSIVIRKRHS